MPYFMNCPLCNRDNKYLKLGGDCLKCSGTGRDWREDGALESFHSWASLTLDKLKECGVVEIGHDGDCFIFTYRNEIPNYSIKKEIAEIREELEARGELVAKAPPSQIFCTHTWRVDGLDPSIESCLKCGKTRKVRTDDKNPNEGFSYNKGLHDNRYYFPNRCYACDYYSDSTGEPSSGKDVIFCNIGGEVPADTGCMEFKPDITAECDSCWNFTRTFEGVKEHLSCDVFGVLSSCKYGRCSGHVRKERTDVEISPVGNAIERSKAYSDTEYLRDSQKGETCFDLHFYDGPHLEKMDLNNTKNRVQENKGMNWIDLDDENELFDAIDKVKEKQVGLGVYSGTKSECCERCDFVIRNSSYPDGSPTGLICKKKDIFVTANGCCDLFDR